MAARSGYDDGMLMSVISATETALGRMRNENQVVEGLRGMLPAVNNSTSGVKLAGLLGDWSSEYHKIVGQLEALNGKAQELLRVNRSVETETSGAAQ